MLLLKAPLPRKIDMARVALPPDIFRTVVLDRTIHIHCTYHILFRVKDKSKDLPFHHDLSVGPSLGPYTTRTETSVENDVEAA